MPTLNWRCKDAVLNHHLDVPYHLLRCEPELSTGTAGSGNLIVEGDNLVALLPGPGSGFRTATLGFVTADTSSALTVRGYTAAGKPNPAYNGGHPIVLRDSQ